MILSGKGRVLTIDIDPPDGKPQHPRITYLHGSSIVPETVTRLCGLIGETDKVLVILDSDHHRDHVLNELRIYSQMIRAGGYIIVEVTNVNGHPVLPDFGPGPMEAVDIFLREESRFRGGREPREISDDVQSARLFETSSIALRTPKDFTSNSTPCCSCP